MKPRALLAGLFAFVLALARLSATTAAPEPRDLAPDLAYLRAHSLGESLPALNSPALATRALVLDLRYATTAETDATELARLLAARGLNAPRWFVLVSPETPGALSAVLATPPRGVLTLGVEGSRPAPRVVVTQAADADRRAYDAAGGGMTIEALITGKVEKERYDEASLVREFENGVADPAPPPAPDPTAQPPPEKAPVLTDRVLQRAVHLHRALQALRPRAR